MCLHDDFLLLVARAVMIQIFNRKTLIPIENFLVKRWSFLDILNIYQCK